MNVREVENKLGQKSAEKMMALAVIDLIIGIVTTIGVFAICMLNLPTGLAIGVVWMVGSILGSILLGCIIIKILSTIQMYAFFSREERVKLEEIQQG